MDKAWFLGETWKTIFILILIGLHLLMFGQGMFWGMRLTKEVMHPDSTYQKAIETFSMI